MLDSQILEELTVLSLRASQDGQCNKQMMIFLCMVITHCLYLPDPSIFVRLMVGPGLCYIRQRNRAGLLVVGVALGHVHTLVHHSPGAKKIHK